MILYIYYGVTLFQDVADSTENTPYKETHLLLQKSQYILHQWFYAAKYISGWCLMLFWTKKYRIENK